MAYQSSSTIQLIMKTFQDQQHPEKSATPIRRWETVIGLEVHAQLNTASKLFSGAATIYGREPNAQACIIDLALPGVLPVLNSAAVALAVKFGLCVNADIAHKSVFARKNYFYPDLPKGYQISQYELPIISNGYLDIEFEDGNSKRVNIVRAHLEEDAGKLMHENFHGMSGVDFNRAGIPLLEIVSAPDMRSSQEASLYLKTLHSLVRYLDVCDGNMQEGSFRCDINVSIRRQGESKLGTRTETKNLNSFRFVERAIECEVKRQIEILEAGGRVVQETMLYDADSNSTRPMRSKEEALDYRYFPDPDLLPLVIDDEYIQNIRQTLPELPWQKCRRFQEECGLNKYDANILSSTKEMAEYFEAMLQTTSASPKLAANWIISELLGALNKEGVGIIQSPISPQQLAKLLDRIHDQTISGKIAKEIFSEMFDAEGAGDVESNVEKPKDVDAIIERKGLKQISGGAELAAVIDNILAANPNQIAQYKEGKTQIFGFFVGKVMQATKGKANPKVVNEMLQERLK